MEPWQQNMRSLDERFSHLLISGCLSDVTFIVGVPQDQKRFKLHKFMLSMYSEVFREMFYGSLPRKKEIEVTDITPAIFEKMVKYIYECYFTIDSIKEAIDTYYCADKYDIANLRETCLSNIDRFLSADNISLVYSNPRILATSKLWSRYKNILSTGASSLIKNDNFLNCPLELVQSIVKLEAVDICEEEIFDFVLKWAENRRRTMHPGLSLRSVMDHFLSDIRFLAMTEGSFQRGPVASGILTNSEIQSISANLGEPGSCELPSWCSKKDPRGYSFE